MRTHERSGSVLQDAEMPVQAKLAGLWASFMFLYAYVDILSFYKPGVIEDILAGIVWQFDITQTWAVGSLALMTVPILMVFLSLALPARANRVTNLIVAAVYLVVSVSNGLGESWVYYYGFAIVAEVAVLALVLRYAWTWPRTAPLAATKHELEPAGQIAAH